MKSTRYAKMLAALLLAVLVTACANVPLTGRRQLNLVKEAELGTMATDQYQTVMKESTVLPPDSKEVVLVRKVGKRLADATERYLTDNGISTEGYAWEFNVIKDDKTVNAWCMPSGKIAFYTGILPITKDETGVAVVMGHEIAHAVARHGNERMSQQMVLSGMVTALSTAVKEKPEATQKIFLGVFGAGAKVGVMLPFSRSHEAEADRIGLTLMAMAGYDPREAPTFWERMSEGGGSPPEILSTHPGPENRVENIKSLLPEALPHYQAQKNAGGAKK